MHSEAEACRVGAPAAGLKTQDPASARKRIALVAADLSTGGGVNRVVRDLAAIFADDLGFEPTVFNARSAAPPTYPLPRAALVEHRPDGASPIGYLRVMWAIRRRRFDYVLGFWPQENIALAFVFLFSKTRLILCEHISWHHPGKAVRLLRRLAYPLAWRVLVLNEADLGYFGRWLRNVGLLSNCVAAAPPPRSVAREKLILAVGHVDRRKNFDDAIRAFALSGLEQEGWSLAIVGDGSDTARLRQMIADLGLRSAGIHPATDDIASWYARASIQLVTSPLEVFSLVLAEGMKAGVVPIAYASDGPSFILKDEPDLLVPLGDLEALAARLKQLARSDSLASRGAALSASVERRFSREVIAGQWRELLG
jgi:amylovoran biosynthesis glycosyltransferase AmsD